MRIDLTMTQKEETYQVILDIIKNSACYNAFLITADVTEIYMQQFWFTVKKIKKTTFYEFDLDDKKCKVDVELFRKILGICPRVPNEDFIIPPFEESMITFLYKLGYKGLLNKLSNMFVDHMHQPWRTLAAIINKLKFISKGEESHVYGLPIPDTMLTDEIKNFEACQMYVALCTGLVPLKISRGKGSKGKKAIVAPEKKSTIIADDNIVPEPDVVFELGKSISITKAKEQEEARRVHETHERLVTKRPTSVEESNESDGKPANRPTRRRRPTSVFFRDTSNVSKKKSLDQSQKLKGIQVMSEEEQLATDTKKAIKAYKEAHKIQQQIEDSNEGAGITLEVPDESTGKFTTSSEGDGIVPEGSEDDSHQSNDEHVKNDEIIWLSTDDEEKANKDDHEKDDDRIKNDAEKAEEENDANWEPTRDEQAMEDQANDDIVGTLITMSQKEKPKVPPLSSSRSLSSNYDNYNTTLIPLTTPPITSEAPPVTTTIPDPLLVVIQRLDDRESKFEAWTKVDHSKAIEALLQANVINEIKNQLPKVVKDLVESRMENTMIMASKSYEKHPPHKALYDALIQSLFVDEDDMDKAAAAAEPSIQLKTKESKRSKKSSTLKETSKGNTPPKASSTDKIMNAEEAVAEPTEELTMDAEENIINDDVVNDVDQPQDDAVPKIDNALKNNWFKQPPRPSTPDPEWNKCQIFSKNRLKLDKITKANLVGLVYKLLKGTHQSNIELEYNLEECRPGHLTIPVEHFFKNNLEYLKSKNIERKYTTSITKTKATRSQINKLSRHDVYSTLKILSVVSVMVDNQFGYGYLKEIVVRRAYRKLYTFKEGDLINIHLNDIEDMLLLVVQYKLFHLDGDVIVDLAMLLNFRMGYNKGMPRRKWTDSDQRRLGIIVKLFDEKLLERRIIQNLERLVGARELETDYRLMQQTV
ncbi:hypothetical protein Tco_1578078 [Tanacetum coccineum]